MKADRDGTASRQKRIENAERGTVRACVASPPGYIPTYSSVEPFSVHDSTSSVFLSVGLVGCPALPVVLQHIRTKGESSLRRGHDVRTT